MANRPDIVREALSLFDGLIYLDKKLIVSVDSTSLHPSETHLLACALEGMSFTEIAMRFGISKAAVSRAFARLSAKGVLEVTKDAARKNRASVTLTPKGEALFERAQHLRAALSAALVERLDAYDARELEVLERFVRDLDDYVKTSFHSIPDGGVHDA